MRNKFILIFLLILSASIVYSDPQEEKIDISNIKDASVLWRLFLDNPDSKTGADILLRLGTVGKGNRVIIDNINNYLMGKNLLFRSGETVDYTIISVCISTLMELGDNSSYPALFSVLYAGYPEVITSEAQGALEVIPGNLQQFLVNVIMNNPPEEKFAAFTMGVNSDRLTVSQRGQLAELALEQGLASTDNNIDLTAMRYSSILLLTRLRWTRANALAIRHYYRVQTDYLQNSLQKERFIEAITCLGAVGNSDAALVLCLQLGLINARTESTGAYDSEITLAIVQALGKIGYNAAFDHLLNVSYLSYPEEIQAAAREAVARLKW
ncbi:HEAT repeat domain-containing protein [Treponema sp. R6D11]